MITEKIEQIGAEIQKLLEEALIFEKENKNLKEKLEVVMVETDLETAKKHGALGEFEHKYGNKVKIYTIGGPLESREAVSKEICGGPHVKNTGELGHFRIKKEESSSAGVRRIKAVLE